MHLFSFQCAGGEEKYSEEKMSVPQKGATALRKAALLFCPEWALNLSVLGMVTLVSLSDAPPPHAQLRFRNVRF